MAKTDSVPEGIEVNEVRPYPSTGTELEQMQRALGGMLPGYSTPKFPPPMVPVSLTLPIRQVGTGKRSKGGASTGRIKSWVTAEIARFLDQAEQAGVERVTITVYPA